MKEIDEMAKVLESKLTALGEERNIFKRLMACEKAARDAIEKLERFFVKQKEFNDDQARLVHFNRNLAPPFYAQFIYFSRVRAFEYLKLDESVKECEKLCKAELAGVKHFFKKHSDFRRYYLSGKTGRDPIYFQKEPPSIIELDDLVVGISPDVNRGCLLVAYMKAFDDYTEYLKATMRKAQSAPGIDSDLKWHGDVSDLNEVATVLEGYIMKGNRPATLKEIRQAFGTLLQTNLDNGDQLDYNRRNNENDGPSFLGKLDEKREKRKNNLDDNQRSRKRRL